MKGVPPDRVVEVRCPQPDGTNEVGSGTVVGDRLVLTAAHVVHDSTGRPFPLVRIRLADQQHWVEAKVVWPTGSTDAADDDDDAAVWDRQRGVDAALVRIEDSAWQQPKFGPVRWGRLTGRNPNSTCAASGYPRVLRTPEARRGREPMSGRVVSIGDLADGRYDIHIEGATPDAEPETHPWGGMSGAGLFAGDLLIGVVVIDQPEFAHNRLTAVPVSALAADTTFTALLRDDAPSATVHTDAWTSQDAGSQNADVATTGSLALESVELSPVLSRREQVRRRRRFSPASLLVADQAVVPFVGREKLLADLTAWCLDDTLDVDARLLTGPGGQGKTRLALHLAHQLRTAHGWIAGPLAGDAPSPALPVHLTPFAETAVPVLLVVDYAETRTSQVDRLLSVLWGSTDTAPVRVLLLARAAGDWYDQLHLRHEDVLTEPPTALARLHDTVPDRQNAFRQATTALASHLTRSTTAPTADWTALADRLPMPDLSSPTFGSALTLQLTALNALLAAGPNPLTPIALIGQPSRDGHTPEDELLQHEARYWQNTARDRGLDYQPATLRRAVAAATLLGAADEQQAATTISRIPGLSDVTDDARLAVNNWLRDLYPHPDGQYWGSLQPDRLGEQHIGRLTREDPHILAALLPPPQASAQQAGQAAQQPRGKAGQDRNGAQSYQALTVLVRAATNHPHLPGQLAELLTAHLGDLGSPALRVATEAGDATPLTTALQHALTYGHHDFNVLMDLGNQLPRYSLALADFSADLLTAVAEAAIAASVDDPLGWNHVAARSLHNLSVRLAHLGRRERALAAIERAVELYRALSHAQPDAFTPKLALSLNNLSLGLREVGRREEALTASKQAVEMYRALADAQPDAFTADLTRSLINLSVQLADLGRREEALAAIEQAVELCRALGQARPGAFTPDLASSLNNLSIQLASQGRREEALTAIEQAVQLYRALADARPDAFTPDLASALNNLSNRLADVGRPDDALAAIEQAVELHRALADAQPDAFKSELARSLHILSLALRDVGRWEEALATIEQAVKLYRALVQAHPEVFSPDLASALLALGVQLTDVQQPERAAAMDREAVALYLGLHRKHPDAYADSLQQAVDNLASDLHELGHDENDTKAELGRLLGQPQSKQRK